MKRSPGFTLIELLVFMALFTLVTGAAISYFTNSIRASTLIAQREHVRGEMTLTNQLLISRLREACQVYPQGTSLTFASVPGTSSAGSRAWRVGTDSMAAVIVPTDGAAMFYAFYLLNRSEYVAQVTDDAQRIPALPADTSSFILMQYAVPMNADACQNRPTSLPSAGAAAQLVAQYVRPPASGEPAFEIGTDSAVVFRLRFEVQSGGKNVVYPSLNADPMTGAVIGRNLAPSRP